MSDNLDRLSDDFDKKLQEKFNQMPPKAISWVLEKWEDRIDGIASSITEDNSALMLSEVAILQRAICEIKAACAFEKGDMDRAFNILLHIN